MSTDTKLDTETTGPISAAYADGLKASPPVLQVGRIGEKPRVGDDRIPAVEVIESWELNYHLGNAVRKLSDAALEPSRESLVSLHKAAYYLNREIANRSRR